MYFFFIKIVVWLWNCFIREYAQFVKFMVFGKKNNSQWEYFQFRTPRLTMPYIGLIAVFMEDKSESCPTT